MALTRADTGLQSFPDFNRNQQLANAQIYIGVPGLDPAVLANQYQAYVVQENGTQVAVPQPIRTSAGGVPTYLGSPVQIAVAETAYSVKVLSSIGSQIYYAPNNTDLATATSGQISHTPAGTGSVSTTVESQFNFIQTQNSVNVKDAPYYAAGDGVTDDTAAFHAALATGNNVFVPKGTYKISSPLKLAFDGQGFYGFGTYTSELVWHGNGGNLIEVLSGRRDTGVANAAKSNMRFCGFKLSVAASSPIDNLLFVEDGVFHTYIEKIRVSSDLLTVPSNAVIYTEGGGVRQSYFLGCTFRDIVIYGGGVAGVPVPCGIWVEAAIEGLFENVKVYNCEETWRLGTDDPDRVSNVVNCTFIKCQGEIGNRNGVSDNGTALRIYQGRELEFIGCKFFSGIGYSVGSNQKTIRFSTVSASTSTTPFQCRDINFVSCVLWGIEVVASGLVFDSTAFYQNVGFIYCNLYGFVTDIIDIQTDQVPMIYGLDTCHYVEAEPKWNARFGFESSRLIPGFTVNNAGGTQYILQQGSDTSQYSKSEPLLVGANVSLAGLMASAYKSSISKTTVRLYNRSGGSVILSDCYFYTRKFLQHEIESKNSIEYNPPSLGSGLSASPNIPLPGVVVGDFVAVGFGNSATNNLSNLNLFGYVSGTDQVTAYFVNRTGGTIDIAGGTLVAYKIKPDFDFYGTATYDAPSLAANAGVTTTVSVPGARVGDLAIFSMGVNQAGVLGYATVSADDTVSIRFQNESGIVVDLASTTIRVGIFKRHKKL